MSNLYIAHTRTYTHHLTSCIIVYHVDTFSTCSKDFKGIVSEWRCRTLAPGSRLSCWVSIILIIAIYRDTPPQTTCFAPVAFGSWLAPAQTKQQRNLHPYDTRTGVKKRLECDTKSIQIHATPPSLSNSLSVHDNVLDPLSHSGFLTTLATAFQSTMRRCKLQAQVIMSQAVPGLLSTGHLLEATWCCVAKLVLPRKGRNEPDVDATVSLSANCLGESVGRRTNHQNHKIYVDLGIFYGQNQTIIWEY